MDSRKTLSNRLDDNSVEDILINLPVKSLMRFKCVSKTWQSFIEDPSFVELHLSRARQHPQLLISKWRGDSWVIYSPKDGFKGGEAVRKVTLPWCMDKNVTCSIDGLFCVIDDSISSTLIYNLATQQASPWAKTSITLRLDPSEPPTYGFGFDPQTKNYKAVCVWEKPSKSLLSLDVELFCEVFTVGENQWKKIDEVPPVRLYESAGVYANGSVYWRNAGVSDSTPPDSELIVAFDVGSEKFRIVQIPNFITGSPWALKKCGVRRGEMFTVTRIDGHMALIDRVDQCIVKLWISDDSYMEKKMTANWTEETISLPSSFEYLCLNPVDGADEIVMKPYIPASESRPMGVVSLYIYNRTMKSFRKIDISGIPPLSYYDVHVAHESLLPVQDSEKKLDRPTPTDCS